VGLISGLLTLPLAPVRGTAWIAEQIRDQAVEELYGEEAIQAQLHQLAELHEAGEIDDEELVRSEDELLERLAAARGFGGEETHG
jgi:Gas vesicle protein G